MIQPDRDGMVPCVCGSWRHFARPCAACAGPNPAVLPAPGHGNVVENCRVVVVPPPGVFVGCPTAPDARAEADAVRMAASGPRTPGIGEWGGS